MKLNFRFGPPKDEPDDAAKAPSAKGSLFSKTGTKSVKSSKGATGTKATAPGETGSEESDEYTTSEQHNWTAGSNMTTKAIVGVLWLALIAGPLALGMRMFAPAEAAIVQQSGNSDRVGEAAAVGEFAERAVVAWLETSGEEANGLKQFFGDIRQSRPQHPWTAQRPGVAEVVKLDNGLWSVVIGVDVVAATVARLPADGETPASAPEGDAATTGAEGGTDGTEGSEGSEAGAETGAEAGTETGTEGGAESGTEGGAESGTETGSETGTEDGGDAEVETIAPLNGRRYFQVPILYFEGSMIAQALPAPVAPPTGHEQLETAYREPIPPAHPAHDRIENFFRAMLVTGDQAEMSAYTSPGTELHVVAPADYASAKIVGIRAATEIPAEDEVLADGTMLEVQATVDLRGLNGQRLDAQYALSLTAREGRWEVTDVRASPLLAEEVPTPTPTPTPTDTATPAPSGSSSETDAPTDSPSGDATGEPTGDATGDPSADPTGDAETEPTGEPLPNDPATDETPGTPPPGQDPSNDQPPPE